MRLLGFTVLLFAGLAATSSEESEKGDIKLLITKDLHSPRFIKYKSQHDIISMLVPLNALNYDDSTNLEEMDMKTTIFFVEADLDNNKLTYKGLYSLKDGKATKLSENGQDAAAPSGDSKKVFIGAADGLYEYKAESNEVVKYGTITDNIISIAVTYADDVIYILTKDHVLYKVTDSGNTKTKVEDVVNAQQIVMDYLHNLYFYTEDKKFYVRTAEGVKEVEGLPANLTEITLIRPPYYALFNGVPAAIDNNVYIIYENGTSEKTIFEFEPKAKPTAFALEALILQIYYAYDKNIYGFDLLTAADLLEELQLRDDPYDKTSDFRAVSRSLISNRKV